MNIFCCVLLLLPKLIYITFLHLYFLALLFVQRNFIFTTGHPLSFTLSVWSYYTVQTAQ